jgi:hypothetical protein
MQESDKLRRTKLIEETKKYRDLLSMLRFTDRRAPSSEQEEITRRNEEISDRLRAPSLNGLRFQEVEEAWYLFDFRPV